MFGQVTHELEVKAPASKVWEIYGTLRLGKIVEELLSDVVEKVDVIEGDGGLGTVLSLQFPAGNQLSFPSSKFKIFSFDSLIIL